MLQLSLLPSDDDLVKIEAVGVIGQAEISGGVDPMQTAIPPGGYGRRVLVDLRRVDFVDSAGIGWLLRCNKRFREAGGMLVLHSIPPMVRQVLDFMKLYDVLRLADDEPAALRVAEGTGT